MAKKPADDCSRVLSVSSGYRVRSTDVPAMPPASSAVVKDGLADRVGGEVSEEVGEVADEEPDEVADEEAGKDMVSQKRWRRPQDREMAGSRVCVMVD